MVARKKETLKGAGRKEPFPSRGPKRSLSTTEIAQAAIRIADREGLEAITMHRVARALGVTTMALYRYFPGKEDLLALMIDSAGGLGPEFGNPAISWKGRLGEWARRCSTIYHNHPWFLEATTVRRTVMGPNELSWMEAALSMLQEAGLSPKESFYAFLAIMGHVRGHATFNQIKNYDSFSRRRKEKIRHLLRPEGDRYSALQAVLETGAFSEDPCRTFDYGLNCILDGIEANRKS